MRPLKLKMTAFGPYRDMETIDFSELKETKLFVISGNTGSGKTTIFDGICFALYGSASGQDRDNYMMLRSDFADDAIHTAVELEFELSGRYFRVLRQLGHVKQGNKSKTGDRYELFEQKDGEEIPAIDRQIVSEIDRKVEELIGLTQDQFKQIVMLPQGEFRKLLTSSTENKEAILRRLFKTEPYKDISEYMRDRKNHAEKFFTQENHTLTYYIESITSALQNREESSLFQLLSEEYYNVNQVLDGMDHEIAHYLTQITVDETTFNETTKLYEQTQATYHQAENLNARFTELAGKEVQLKKLEEQNDVYAVKEKQAIDAEKASEIIPYETQFKELEKEVSIREGYLTEAKTLFTKSEDRLKVALATYEQEEKKQTDRDQLTKEIDQLERFLPIVKASDTDKNELHKLRVAGKESFDQLEKVKASLVSLKAENEREEKQLLAVDEIVSKLPEKERKRGDLREQFRVVRDYLKLEKAGREQRKQFEKHQQLFMASQTVYLEQEKIWLASQASILATHLHDGEACPVCGSEEHPMKASSKDDFVTKEQLEDLKKKMDDHDEQFRNARADYQALLTQFNARTEEVKLHDIDPKQAKDAYDRLEKAGINLAQEVEKLEKIQKETSKRKEVHFKKREESNRLDKERENLERVFSDQKTTFETKQAVYNERIEKIPEQIRVLSELKKQIEQTQSKKQNLETAWKVAQKNRDLAREEQTVAESNVGHAVKQLNETKQKHTIAKARFAQAVSEAGFTAVETYRLAKMDRSERERLKNEIEMYNQNKILLNRSVSELKKVLKDQVKQNLSELKQELDTLKTAYEVAFKTLNQSKKYLEEAERLKENIWRQHAIVKEKEKQLSVIADLHDVIRGQNSKKISFERYLQITYLEQIIEAANHRLEKLSNGQFLLMRSDRQESHGKQSGLALDVFDGYTGQTRDVKTLSGGEKFNASLCLALGMSDVIQSFQGNIAIETMFIDEGFGSLDEEALHKSIDVLIDLQKSGRMIGIISHVQELKTIFPAVLEVKKTQQGYSETQFIIK